MNQHKTASSIGDRVRLPNKAGYEGVIVAVDSHFIQVRRDDGSVFHCARGIVVSAMEYRMIDLPSKVAEQIREDAVEEALGGGMIRVMPATHQDPACYDADVDVTFTPSPRPDEDEDDSSFVIATAKVGRHVVFAREYEHTLDEVYGWEDV